MKRQFIFLLFIISLVFLASGVFAQTEIASCGVTINVSGAYELLSSITSNTGDCIRINTSNVDFNCNGNSILFGASGATSAVGINATWSTMAFTNVTIRNCIINDVTANGTNGRAILFTRISNSSIYNNTIIANGTTGNHGIFFTTGSEGNLIENNTIFVNGTTGSYGIYLLYQSNRNTIRGNNVSVEGTGTNYATMVYSSDQNIIENNNLSIFEALLTGNSDGHTVYFYLGSKNNILRGNTISTSGPARNYLVYLNANSNANYIYNNTITANGWEGSNFGVYVLGCSSNEVTNNTIWTFGTTADYGIALGAASLYNLIKNNTITTNGNTTNNYGVYLNGAIYTNITQNQILAQGKTTGNAGIALNTAPRNWITYNNISTKGTTTGYGLSLTGSNVNYFKGNNISTWANLSTTNSYGVYMTGSDFNIFIKNNISSWGNSTGNSGVYMTSSTNNNITQNWIFANGGNSGNTGITIYTSSTMNDIYSNTIITNGTTTNYGVYVYSANNNEIVRNLIFSNGTTTTNHGVYLSTSANNNSVLENNISTYGTTTNHGVSLLGSDLNKIKGNNILANGSTIASGTTTSNYGVSLTTNSYDNLIEHNNMTNDGGKYNYGFSLLSNCRNNIFKENNVTTNGAGWANDGAYISDSYNNTIENNVIFASGSAMDYGIRILLDSEHNLVKGNIINTSGSSNSSGIYLAATVPNYPENNIFKNNSFLAVAGFEFDVATAEIDGIQLINQNIENYSFIGAGSLIIVENESAAKIQFLTRVNGSGGNLSANINITENSVHVESTVSGLNKSAIVTIYNRSTTSTELQIMKDGAVCPSSTCTNLTSMQAGSVMFNVTNWSTYSIEPVTVAPSVAANLPAETFVSYSGNVSFNFTVTDDTSLTLSCTLYIDSLTNQTIVANAGGLTNIFVSNLNEGSHTWRVGCLDNGGNENFSELRNMSITISTPAVDSTSPTNEAYKNNASSVLLNYTVYDTTSNLLTVWLYGDGGLLNTDLGIANATLLSYNWTGLSLGRHNWTVKVGNELKNSSEYTYWFNLINLTLDCEAGGPYQKNAVVLIQGNVTNGTSAIAGEEVNVSIYNSTNSRVGNNTLTTSSLGGFQTSFSNLEVDNYTVYIAVDYEGIIVNKSYSFVISLGYNEGYDAGFIAGNESGYILGFSEGNITGFNLGNISGFIIGNASGFNEGNLTGFNTGYVLGNETGFNVGYVLGNTSGYILGNASGFILGNYTGFILGNQTGFIEGNITGYIAGFDAGNITGFILGNQTGYILGNISGFILGNASGYAEGYDAGFIAGTSPASLSLDKIASFYNISNESVWYNITLRAVNKGGENATSVVITDTDSASSPYDIGTMTAGETIFKGYILNFSRNSTTWFHLTNFSNASGLDSSLNSISAVSFTLNLTIPQKTTDAQLTVVKSLYHNSENTTAMNYTLTISIVNSGGVDLSGVSIIDDDMGVSETTDLTRGQLWNYSSSIIIDKAASNEENTFSKAYAVANSATYESNELSIVVPGYGGPADVVVYAPTSTNLSTSFDSIIEVLNKNPDIGQDFVIDYWITNPSEKQNYSSGQKTIYVPASGGTNTTVTLTSPSSSGSYRLKAIAVWTKGTATAYDTFLATNETTEDDDSDDDSGNTNSGSSDSGGGGGGGGAATPSESPATITGAVVSEVGSQEMKNGVVKEVKKNEKVEFNIPQGNNPEKKYNLEVSTVTQTEAVVVIESENVTFNLNVGGDKKIDLDSDGYYDLYVRLNSIENESVSIVLQSISEKKEEVSKQTLDETEIPEWMTGILDYAKNIIQIGMNYTRSVNIHFILGICGGVVIVLMIRIISKKKISWRKDGSRLKGATGLLVYGADGDKIGKIKEIYLEKNKIYGWLITLDKSVSKKMRKKEILIKHKHVHSIKHIMIIDDIATDHLKK